MVCEENERGYVGFVVVPCPLWRLHLWAVLGQPKWARRKGYPLPNRKEVGL